MSALAWMPGIAHAAPPNDAFENAVLIDGENATVSGSNAGATKQPGEPYYADGRGLSVWYRWVAPSNGLLALNVTSPGFSAGATVWEGNPYKATQSIEDLSLIGGSRGKTYVRGGTTYWLAVDSLAGPGSTPGSGPFTLRTALTRAPSHDQFEHAKPLSGAHAADRSTNVNASTEGGEPPHWWTYARESVWYRWTAPATGRTTVDLTGSDFDTVTAVYTGGRLAGLSPVASSDDPKLSFRAVGGQSYAIAVATETGPAGLLGLVLDLDEDAPLDEPDEPPFVDPPGPPANDDLADAQVLTGLKETVRGSNAEATSETGEPAHGHGQGRSVWYRWTPPRSGMMKTTITSDGFTALVEPSTAGSSFSDLEFDGATIGYLGRPVQRGKTYYFAVDANDGDGGDFTLRVALDPAAKNDDYADATVLTGSSPSDLSYIDNATPDADAPNLYSERTPTVWYRWTAPANGLATLDLTASYFTPMEGVYEEADGGRLAWVGQTMDPVMQFWVREGKTYRIQVASQREYSGQLRLALNLVQIPLPPDYSEPPVYWPPDPVVPEQYFPPGDPGPAIPPGPPPPWTPSGRPAERLDLVARVSRSRGTRLTVGCSSGPCKVRVSGRHFRTAAVSAKRPTSVALKLTPAAKRAIRKRGSLRSTVRVTARGSGGRTASLTRKLTVKR